MDRFAAIEIFIRVVDTGSFSATARQCDVGQPAVSKAIAHLDHAVGHHAEGDPLSHAKYSRDTVLTGMSAVRALSDKLEGLVADDLWPLPTYREMLFMK